MISIDEIKTLVAFAELGSLTRASGRLHRTQPAISRRLGILEHELGAPMFERVRGNVRLTEAGRVFLPYAETALAALKDGCEAVRGLQTGLQGTVSLARRRTHGSSTCARRTNVGPALLQSRPWRACLTRRWPRANAGDRGSRASTGKTPGFAIPCALLEALDIPSMRTAIPITAIRRRNGYLSPAATSLLELARRASAGP